MGITLALIAALTIGVSSVYMKKLSLITSHSLVALAFQYVRMIVVVGIAGVGMQGFSVFTPVLSRSEVLLIVCMGVIGALGIWCLLQAYRRMPAGIALVGANVSVCLMYGVNVVLFQDSEVFSETQMVVALVFLCLVGYLLASNHSGSARKSIKTVSRKDIVYPLGTAVAWTVFFGGVTWFVKQDILTPLQSVLFSEVPVAVVLLVYAFVRRYSRTSILSSYQNIHIHVVAIVASVFLVAGNLLVYMAYLHSPANIVNVVKLGSVIVTAAGATWLLKDAMDFKQWAVLVVAMCSLGVFMFLG